MVKNEEIKKEEGVDLDPDKKPVREPSFGVHKMPKGYKTGRFDLPNTNKEKNNSNKAGLSKDSFLTTKNKEEKKHHSKKFGFFIMFFGVIFVLFLAYLVFSYINNPGESVFKFPSFNFSKEDNTSLNQNNNTGIILDETEEPNNNLTDEAEENFIEDPEEEYLFEDFEPIEDFEDFEGIEDIEDFEDIDDNFTENNIDDIPMFDSFVDTDGDGLSDKEEGLLGTSPINIDTDGDGYDDLTELINLYNPAGTGSILENNNVSNYSNGVYSIYYPVNWEIKAVSDDSSVIFLINDNSFIQVLIEKNENQQDIKNWYSSRFLQVNNSSLIEKDFYTGIFSPDFNSFYATDNNNQNVYSLVYNFPENTIPSYYNIFRMMVNSFKLN